MNKLKSNLPFNNVLSAKTNQVNNTQTSSKSNATTTLVMNQSSATNQAIVSIVNQSMASSSSSSSSSSSTAQCTDTNALVQQKKKRAALENISNAHTNSTTSSSSMVTANKDISKKSRVTNQQSTDTIPAASGLKKTDSLMSKKSDLTREKASSKENLSNLPVSSSSKATKSSDQKSVKPVTNNATKKPLKPVQISKPTTKPKLEKQESIEHDLVVPQQQKSLSAECPSKKAKDAKQNDEYDYFEYESKSFMTTNELYIERQLATTKISSSASENSLSLCKVEPVAAVSATQDAEVDVKLEEVIDSAEMVEGWDDIDKDDVDEFNTPDYVSNIFMYYRERETKFVVEDYMKRQPHLNRQMRLLLVDWMVEVQQQLEFNHEVLYLSVKLLDLYLNSRKIEKERLQLLGGAAMFIACKFEERMPPIIDDFIYVSDNAYDRNQLIKMEIDILKTIKFDIGVPLSYTFLRRYSKCVKADMRFLTLARYILELSLQDYNFAHANDSLKACAALYLALKMTVAHEKYLNDNEGQSNEESKQPMISSAHLASTEWNATLVHYTGSFLKDFIDMVPAMNTLLKTAQLSKYKTIFKKYSHQVFFEVAKIPALSDEELERLVEFSKQEPSYYIPPATKE